MRVLVDAHMIGTRETGNETYIVNLLGELAELPDITCAAVVTPGAALPASLSQSDLELISLRPTNDWMRLIYTLPIIGKRWHADILHTTYVGPLLTSCTRVTTVHDVSFNRHPKFFSPRDRLLFATLLPLTLRRANGVIAISQHAKVEIVDLFPYLKNKVYVTPLASSSNFYRPIYNETQLEDVKTRYNIHSEFILSVGNLQPRKNLLRLVKAFDFIRQQKPHLQLVIVGKAQWQSSEVYALVTELGLTEQVAFTGYVSDKDLILLYNTARIFVYPSLYEGFGLPVLEAMACGTPVVTSNISSLPEVAGDAALLVDPFQEQEIARAILAILNTPDLAASLSEKGKLRARTFSWRRTAQETADVYKSVLNQ